MINEKYNKWTILESAGKDKWGSNIVKCQCECGTISTLRSNDIKYHKTSQCRPCGYNFKRHDQSILKSPLAGKGNNFSHGMSRTSIYSTWVGMIKRCAAKKGKDYKWYGSRGITVCEEWKDFKNFYRDMGEKPLKHYLDRIDNDKGYFKENCRWVDSVINSRNRRCVKNKFIPL